MRWILVLLLSPLLLVVSMRASGPAEPSNVSVLRLTGESTLPPQCRKPIPAFGRGYDDAEWETHAVVDPRDPDHVIVSWVQDTALSYITATTYDGGQTWTQALVPGISRCTGGDADGGADEWLSIGADGLVYITGLNAHQDLDRLGETGTSIDSLPLFSSKIYVNTSQDGGATWSPPMFVSPGAPGVFQDRPAITADPALAGTAYLAWAEEAEAQFPPSAVMFARTEDGGHTWTLPKPVYVTDGYLPWSNEVLVLPDGDLLLVFSVFRLWPLPHRIIAMRSDDGGRSWSKPVTIAEPPSTGRDLIDPTDCRGPGTPIRDPDSGECIFVPEFLVSADLDGRGTAYVAWRNGIGDSAAIFLSTSSDGGDSWSSTRVSVEAVEPFAQSLAVGKDGRVAITYYDRRSDVPGDGRFSVDAWIAVSADRGATWEETHLLGPFDMLRAPIRNGIGSGRTIGDYTGLVAVEDGFAAVLPAAAPVAQQGPTDVFYMRVNPSQRGKSDR